MLQKKMHRFNLQFVKQYLKLISRSLCLCCGGLSMPVLCYSWSATSEAGLMAGAGQSWLRSSRRRQCQSGRERCGCAEVWVARWAAQSAAVLLCAPRWSVLCLLVVLLSFLFLLFASDSARVTHLKAGYTPFSFSPLTCSLSHCFYTFTRHTHIQSTPPDLHIPPLMSTSHPVLHLLSFSFCCLSFSLKMAVNEKIWTFVWKHVNTVGYQKQKNAVNLCFRSATVYFALAWTDSLHVKIRIFIPNICECEQAFTLEESQLFWGAGSQRGQRWERCNKRLNAAASAWAFGVCLTVGSLSLKL